MIPPIKRLGEAFPELSFQFNETAEVSLDQIENLDPIVYQKILPSHLMLHLEFSLLGQQLGTKLLAMLEKSMVVDKKELKEQVIAALILAKLLEHIYQYYLMVPREVAYFSQQKKVYIELLNKIEPRFCREGEPASQDESLSFSQTVRNGTINSNLYRLLLTRSKRLLDVIALNIRSKTYNDFLKILGKYTDPVFLPFTCFFYLPRLVVNLFLLIKHTVPGPWMKKEEKSLDWAVRLIAQLQRRWFELGNDILWVPLGFVNYFVLTGALAPVAIYLSIAGFAFDAIWSAVRASIELNRLNDLKQEYVEKLNKTSDKTEHNALKDHLEALEKQIQFERFRLGSHVVTTTIISLAMFCSAPLLAINPIIPLIGAACLVGVCVSNFVLTSLINSKRPKHTIDPSLIKKFGFFPPDQSHTRSLMLEEEQFLEPLELKYTRVC